MKQILIIEDEKDLRDVYSLILTRAGYSVCLAKNGVEGLEAIENCSPTLVLLDIFMPTLDGKGFLLNLDADKYPATKIVVCSNTSDQNLMQEMIALGADQTVTKSNLGPTDLLALVEPYFRAVS